MQICRQCKHFADCQLDAIVNNLTFDPNFNAENCCDFEIYSNADRIRAMSDEELAEFLCAVYDDDDTFGKFINGYIIPCYNEDSIKEWLQQPVEVE